MSEYQYFAFRAIDGPVSEKNLRFMRQQSTRADITPWSFDNEYHYGDFRGNAAEMLRRGYDIHLHYANFGTRTLMIRLQNGLPDSEAAKPYFADDGLAFLKDKQGPGGILCIEPCYEPGDLEDLWDIDTSLDRLVPLRAEILDGDLRPLYLAHLGVALDMNHGREETTEGPVPAGLNKLSGAQRALAALYGIDDHLIAAAARGGPASSIQRDAQGRYAAWIERQPVAIKNEWLTQLLADPQAAVRMQILADFQQTTKAPTWPVVRLDRTIAHLEATAEEIRREASSKAAEKAARQRAKKLADIAADPTKTLRETEELVKTRTTKAYSQIATLLADLRKALAASSQRGLAEEQARTLRSANPTLHMLASELRRKGLLAK